MEFKIKNTGVVAGSSIRLDGLTVITGLNNSGKSTVGKALYATVEAFSDIERKHAEQIGGAIVRMLFDLQRIIALDGIERYIDPDKIDDESCRHIFGLLISPIGIPNVIQKFSPDSFYEALKKSIYMLTPEYLLSITTKPKSDLPKKFFTYLNGLETSVNRAKDVLKKYEDIFNDNENVRFAKIIATDLLRREFSGQVFPVKSPNKEKISRFTLCDDDDNVEFEFKYSDEKGVLDQGRIFNKLSRDNAILIDDVSSFDNMPGDRFITFAFHSGLRQTYDYYHRTKLKKCIEPERNKSALDKYLCDKAYDEIRADIDSILPGDLIIKSDGYYYKTSDSPTTLSLSNLATGSKLFAVLKALLKNGELGYNTILILDEPESHLHPEWQNILAELIVLLVKKLDVSILITTHSINFVAALETYMHEYEIADKTNFYRTAYCSNDRYLVNYECKNDDLGSIYESLTSPYDRIVLKKNSLTGVDTPDND